MKLIIFIAFSFSVICLYSCKKNVITEENEGIASMDASSSSLTDRRSRLSYGDSIFYLKNEPGNYIIRPVRRPRIEGYFKAIPIGLIYDSLSGRINVTQSETGLRYKMYYLTTDGQRADSTQIVISGIDYADGIYDLGAGQNTASPVYAANSLLPLPCDDDDDDDDDDGCEFDERDLDDNGTNDIPGANSLGFRVNRTNAVINLYSTISSGALGLNPQNGSTGDFLFYYRLSDLSNRALQAITVRLYYYNTAADIPASLINELNERNTQNQQVNSFGGTLQPSPDQVTATQTVYSRPRRPPLIIIVGYE
jgi:hypothetical protein